MTRVTVHQAKTHLSELLERAEKGEEVIIARGSVPIVRLVPISRRPARRKFGAMAGKARVTRAFFDSLPEDLLKGWEGG